MVAYKFFHDKSQSRPSKRVLRFICLKRTVDILMKVVCFVGYFCLGGSLTVQSELDVVEMNLPGGLSFFFFFLAFISNWLESRDITGSWFQKFTEKSLKQFSFLAEGQGRAWRILDISSDWDQRETRAHQQILLRRIGTWLWPCPLPRRALN